MAIAMLKCGMVFIIYFPTPLNYTAMRKFFILTAISLSLLGYSCRTRYKLADERFTLIETTTSKEHGKNLVENICGGCHYNEGAKKYIGNKMDDLPKFMGKVYSANLTQSKMHGVAAKYTDAELSYLLKTGIAKDGRFIPYMLRPTMAEDDVNDIIVYLRSSDPAVRPGDTTVGTTHLNFLGRWANHLIAKPQPYVPEIKRPATDDATANGKYLVDIIGCYHCHSKSMLKLDYMHADQSKGYLQGGQKLKSTHGKIRSANLTPDKETGIGNYTETAFATAIKHGKARDGRALRSPMPQFATLSDKQVHDIYTYLKTLPPAHHSIKH